MTLNFISIQASQHAIKSVTISKSNRAEVVRTFLINLKEGRNKLEIKGLPSDIHAVRTSGLGSSARLDDFLCAVGRDNSAEAVSMEGSTTSENIRALRAKGVALESEKAIRSQELQVLTRYAQTLSAEHISPKQLSEFLQSYVEQSRKIVQANAELDEKIRQVVHQIDAEKSSARQGNAMTRIDAVISSESDISITLVLTYIVNHCSWHATYELRTTTANGRPSSSVSLHYLATVKQSTGEDWADAKLTLSTNQTNSIPKNLPRLGRLEIQPAATKAFQYQNQLQTSARNNVAFSAFSNTTGPGQATLFGASQSAQTGLFGVLAGGNPPPNGTPQAAVPFGTAVVSDVSSQARHEAEDENDAEYEVLEEEGAPGSMSQPGVIVKETPLSMTFTVSESSNIPSDGLPHQVTLAVLPFQAKISYITIPRNDPHIFLQCEVKNSSEYRLLTGPVNIIVDDSYMSTTSLSTNINPGDSFVCLLGNDTSTKVVYTRSSKTVKSDGGAFAEDTNITTYTTKVSIHNKHAFDIVDLVVLDSVPISEDKRVKVILRKPLGLADAKDGDSINLDNNGLSVNWEALVDGKGGRSEGKFEWKWKVASGETVSLEAEYYVKVPRDVAWVLSHFPNYS